MEVFSEDYQKVEDIDVVKINNYLVSKYNTIKDNIVYLTGKCNIEYLGYRFIDFSIAYISEAELASILVSLNSTIFNNAQEPEYFKYLMELYYRNKSRNYPTKLLVNSKDTGCYYLGKIDVQHTCSVPELLIKEEDREFTTNFNINSNMKVYLYRAYKLHSVAFNINKLYPLFDKLDTYPKLLIDSSDSLTCIVIINDKIYTSTDKGKLFCVTDSTVITDSKLIDKVKSKINLINDRW